SRWAGALAEAARDAAGRRAQLLWGCAMGMGAAALMPAPQAKGVEEVRRRLRHRVVAAAAPGVAADKTAKREPGSGEGAVPRQRVHRVIRAGRQIAAARRQRG